MKRHSSSALALLLLLSAVAQAQQPPNIVFIFTDDQAAWALGASGNPQAFTPHLDKLFSESAYLKNAFTTTPVCSPSRASLMTSRYGSELGITDWIKPSNERELGLDPATVTWSELLQKGGYETALVGKWHLGLPDRFHPTATGFDHFMGFRGGGTSTADPRLEIDGVEQPFKGLTTDILTDHAIKFLDRDHQKPFSLCLHYRAPHTRWLPVADEDWAPYEDLDPTIPNPDYPKLDVKRVKRMTREYLASVRGVDRNVGRVLRRLDDLKLRDNTVVIFSRDHGYSMGHNGIWHKGNGHWVLTTPPAATRNIPKNQRPNMYDHSIRVPTCVRWPNVITPGTVITKTASNLDWFPTILEMAQVEPPQPSIIRGRSMLRLLKGENVSDWDNDFYAEYSTHHQSKTHMRMYRTPEWKLVLDFLNPERHELFDLQKDPAETTNRYHDQSRAVQKVVSTLEAKIRNRMTQINDPALR